MIIGLMTQILFNTFLYTKAIIYRFPQYKWNTNIPRDYNDFISE